MKKVFIDGTGPNKIKIIGDKAKLAVYLGTSYLDTIEQTTANLPKGTTNVTAHSRQRYPGGPAIPVSAHSRLTDPNAGYNLGTLPGKSFFLERPDGVIPGTTRPRIRTSQFAFTGRLSSLKDIIRANCIIETTLRAPSGDAWKYTPNS